MLELASNLDARQKVGKERQSKQHKAMNVFEHNLHCDRRMETRHRSCMIRAQKLYLNSKQLQASNTREGPVSTGIPAGSSKGNVLQALPTACNDPRTVQIPVW